MVPDSWRREREGRRVSATVTGTLLCERQCFHCCRRRWRSDHSGLRVECTVSDLGLCVYEGSDYGMYLLRGNSPQDGVAIANHNNRLNPHSPSSTRLLVFVF